jgi:hypothetical protein
MAGSKDSAERLARSILYRRSVDIISGEATGPVRAGWATGHFYDPATIAHTPSFEIKEWGSADCASRFNPEWDAHTECGPEYLRVTQGELRVIFGYRDEVGGISELPHRRVLRAGDTAVLPPGLLRRYEASSDVRGITVRARSHP